MLISSRSGSKFAIGSIAAPWKVLFGESLPDILFGQLKIACQHIHRFPAARAHDGSGIKALIQQVLCRADANRMAAEFGNLVAGQPGSCDRVLNHPAHRGGLETAIDDITLINHIKLPRGGRTARIEPLDAQDWRCV